jgi:hypothetical protein
MQHYKLVIFRWMLKVLIAFRGSSMPSKITQGNTKMLFIFVESIRSQLVYFKITSTGYKWDGISFASFTTFRCSKWQSSYFIGPRSKGLWLVGRYCVCVCVHCRSQGCQMVCFQTKNPNLGKFWSALDLENVYVFYAQMEYFSEIWEVYGHLVHFVSFWYIFPFFVSCTRKNLATLVEVAEIENSIVVKSPRHHFC